MKTPRLVAVLIVIGVIVALIVQNPAPILALNFLGWQSPPLPLAIWLLAAMVCGALTVLALALLLPSPAPRSKYRPTAYSRVSEASTGSEPRYGSASGAEHGPEGYSSENDGPENYGPENYGPENYQDADYAAEPDYRDYMPPEPMGSQTTADSEWGDWTRLRSPAQRSDWDQPAPTVDFATPPRTSSNQARRSASGSEGWKIWPFGNSAAEQQQRAEQSWQDLAEGWDGVEERAYPPAGGSAVEDALDDIDQGWDGAGEGSYAYGYGSEEPRRDNIYGPADEDEDWIGETADAYEAEAEAEESEVVDADYRVIIPPYNPDEAADDQNDEPRP